MLTQPNSPLPLDTSRGLGFARIRIDDDSESHVMCEVAMDWMVPEVEVRMGRPATARASDTPIPTPPVESPPPDLPEQPAPPIELPPPTTPGGPPPLQMNAFFGGEGAAFVTVAMARAV